MAFLRRHRVPVALVGVGVPRRDSRHPSHPSAFHVLGAHAADRGVRGALPDGTTLSTTSFMGIIAMVGIVVSNGVLLVEYINDLRREGMPLHTAVPRGGPIRLRPILMSTLATVVGLIPMALAIGVGTEANQQLAIAVIGGLLVSTFFTLVLIPTLYVILEERFPRELAHAEESMPA